MALAQDALFTEYHDGSRLSEISVSDVEIFSAVGTAREDDVPLHDKVAGDVYIAFKESSKLTSDPMHADIVSASSENTGTVGTPPFCTSPVDRSSTYSGKTQAVTGNAIVIITPSRYTATVLTFTDYASTSLHADAMNTSREFTNTPNPVVVGAPTFNPSSFY
jgi:hypothetical protein